MCSIVLLAGFATLHKGVWKVKKQSINYNTHSIGARGRVIAMQLIVASVVLVYASNALAEPPLNDERSAAKFFLIGDTDTIDTTEASTAPDDPECSGQGPTVWYSFTPEVSTFIGANTFGSEYDTTLSAYVEEEGSLLQIACNDDSIGVQSRIRFNAEAHVTYLFMVGAFGSGPGGNMTFNLIEAPPPVQIELAIDSRGTFIPSTGIATLRGTVTCTGSAGVYIDGSLRQRVGRLFIDGYGSNFFSCDGTTPWSMEVSSDDGLFAGGRADANVFAAVFDEDSFAFGSATVRLNGSRR